MTDSPRDSCDIVVAGAGPAGAAVAGRLRQRGFTGSVLLLDRYHFPRDKPCGGALTGHIESAMADCGLALRVPRFQSPTATVSYGAFERRVEMGRPVCMIRRTEYDADLVAQVRDMGIAVVEGEGVRSYVTDDTGVSVTTSNGRTVRAKVLIGADGAASIVRKQLAGRGASAPAKKVPHRLFMAELDRPAAYGATANMLYDFTAMARGLRGYVWVFPAPPLGGVDRINVGLMHYPAYRRGGKDLTELLGARMAELGIELPERASRGWPVWGYHPKTPVSGERVLTVGDAAGIDGLTGEGIAVAMEQAAIAVDLALEGLASNSLSFHDYRRRLRRATVGRELALDRWLARLLYNSDRDATAWKRWLSLVLFDDKVIEMYASRVDGSAVLADHKLSLYGALARHAVKARSRRARLDAAIGA